MTPGPCPVTVTAADGTGLATLVLPAATAHAPDAQVLLVRTPYEARPVLEAARGWWRRGLTVVVQDVRGRHGSDGRWRPYEHEAADGAATLDALVDPGHALSHAVGGPAHRIVCLGSSYEAHCALAAAAARPRLVRHVVAMVPALGSRRAACEPTGLPRLYGRLWWWSRHGVGRRDRPCPVHDVDAAAAGPMRTLPATSIPEALGLDPAGWLSPWAPAGDPAAARDAELRRLLPDSPAPELTVVAGLYDVFAADALDLARAWPGAAHLVLGPWQHDLGTVHRGGDGDVEREPAHRVSVGSLVWERLAQPTPPAGLDVITGPTADRHTARIAIVGADRWFSGDVGAIEASRVVVAAAPVGGDEAADFVADPADPHPALLGPIRGEHTLRRQDALVFATPPRPTPLDVVGRTRVRLSGLHCARPGGRPVSPACWAVRLLVRRRGGRAIQLAHTAARTSGTALELVLPPVAHRIGSGDELLVQVSADQFPLFARDPGDGSDPLTATRLHPTLRRVRGPVVVDLPVLGDRVERQAHDDDHRAPHRLDHADPTPRPDPAEEPAR